MTGGAPVEVHGDAERLETCNEPVVGFETPLRGSSTGDHAHAPVEEHGDAERLETCNEPVVGFETPLRGSSTGDHAHAPVDEHGDAERLEPPSADEHGARPVSSMGAPARRDATERAAVSESVVRSTPILDDSVRIDDGAVYILDRRVFPAVVEWVRAETAAEVAQAIRDMVTQSSGPMFAAAAAMELTAAQSASLPLPEARANLHQAGVALSSARPTNNHPREAVEAVEAATMDAASTADLVERAVEASRAHADLYRARSRALGEHTVALLGDGARILTHCWMDTYLIELVRAAEAAGKSFDWVATETRPYLQGARLTAHTLAEMGQPVTLITDGMGAAALAPGSTLGPIDALVTAADRVSADGSVVNKIGTLGLALAASAFGVDFHALVQAPDFTAPRGADIVIEQRDPRDVLFTLGHRSASDLVTEAWYPAFDVTPARFVTSIVTDRGVFAPDGLDGYLGAQPFELIPRPASRQN